MLLKILCSKLAFKLDLRLYKVFEQLTILVVIGLLVKIHQCLGLMVELLTCDDT